MKFILDISGQRFSLDGIEYFKNFLSKVNGNKITIYNAYDSCDVLVEAIIFSQITLNGIVYPNASALQSALLSVIYTRSSLNGLIINSPLFNYFSNQTGFTILGQNIIFNNGWAWFIMGNPHSNPANVIINIPFASAGKKRIDVIVANINNTFQLVQGMEVLNSNSAAEPPTPPNTIKATLLIVRDSSISQGGVNNGYGKWKIEEKAPGNTGEGIEFDDLARGRISLTEYCNLGRYLNLIGDNNVHNPLNYEILSNTGLVSQTRD